MANYLSLRGLPDRMTSVVRAGVCDVAPLSGASAALAMTIRIFVCSPYFKRKTAIKQLWNLTSYSTYKIACENRPAKRGWVSFWWQSQAHQNSESSPRQLYMWNYTVLLCWSFLRNASEALSRRERSKFYSNKIMLFPRNSLLFV